MKCKRAKLCGNAVPLSHSKTFTLWRAQNFTAKWFVSAVRRGQFAAAFWNGLGGTFPISIISED